MPRFPQLLGVLLTAATLAACAGAADAQKQCAKGKPCGKTCIARDKICHVDRTARAEEAPAAAGESAARTTSADENAERTGLADGGSELLEHRAFGKPSSLDAIPPARLAGICVIQRVVDGDTVACEGGRRVRLLLIDAPEIGQGSFGRLAAGELARLLPRGARTVLERDVQTHDRYGRTLAYVHLGDGRMANEEMLRAGFAIVSVYVPNVQHVERLRAAQREAVDARRGLWATSAFACEPAAYRRGLCGR